jgi:hypothetical protein
VQIKDAFKGLFVKDASYKITLDALGTKSGTQDAKLSVYLSGSAFDFESTDYFNQDRSGILHLNVFSWLLTQK